MKPLSDHPISRSELCSIEGFKLAFMAFVLKLALIIFGGIQSQQISAPPIPGDGVAYSLIARSIVSTGNFGCIEDDTEWLKAYLGSTKTDYTEALNRAKCPSSTLSRAPGLPYLIAATYLLFGNSFLPFQILNSLALALALSIAVMIAFRIGGKTPAMICAAIGIIDLDFNRYALAFLSEPISALGSITLSYFLTEGKLNDEKSALFLGINVAFLALARSILILFSPMVFILILLSCRNLPLRKTLRISSIYLGTVAVVFSPWLIRNLTLSSGGYPFGTQYALNSPTAWSNEAIEDRGLWNPRTMDRVNFACEKSACIDKTDLRKELCIAECAARKTKEWLKANPWKIVTLLYLKFRSLLWDDVPIFKLFVLLSGLLGIISLGKTRIILALTIPLVVCILGVVLSWNVDWGRFLLPAFLQLYIGLALGLTLLINTLSPAHYYKTKTDFH